jgi:hypothetical protein
LHRRGRVRRAVRPQADRRIGWQGCFSRGRAETQQLGFEDGYPGDNVCGINWYQVGYGCNPSNTSLPGWVQTGGGIDWHNNTPDPLEPAAQDGIHTIDLIGFDDAGAIEQSVPTTPGVPYALSFWYAGHPVCIMTNGTGSASAAAAAGASSVNGSARGRVRRCSTAAAAEFDSSGSAPP